MKKHVKVLFLSITVLLSYSRGMGQLPWDLLTSGTDVTLNGVDFINPDTGIVVGDQGLIMKTTDGGLTWETKVPSGFGPNLNDVRIVSETKAFAVGSSGVLLQSSDAGETWQQEPSGTSSAMVGISVDRTSGKGLISGESLLMLWTDDWGENWSLVQDGYMSNFYKAFMANGEFGIAFGENSIFQPMLGYTMNAGTTFDMWNFYPETGGVLYEGKASDGYFFSQDKGFVIGRIWDGRGFITKEINWFSHNWNSLLVSSELRSIDFIDQEHGVTVGGTNMDWIFLETPDSGITWNPALVNGNGKGFNDVVLVGNTGYAVGWSGQIVKKHLPVPVVEKQYRPVSLTVYPNPARGETTLFIDLDHPGHLSLFIYDITGVTKKQVTGEFPAGRQSIPLDISDVPGGIYFCVLNYQGGSAARKFLVE